MVESTRVRSKRLSFSGKKTLSSFMQVNIASLRQSGKLRTSETYRATLNSFMKFMDGKDVLLSNMDAELMMGYETYLKAQGVTAELNARTLQRLPGDNWRVTSYSGLQ